jgi:hypothetical protein
MWFAFVVVGFCAVVITTTVSGYYWNRRGDGIHERKIEYRCGYCPTQMFETYIGGTIRSRVIRYHGDHYVCEEVHKQHDWIEV